MAQNLNHILDVDNNGNPILTTEDLKRQNQEKKAKKAAAGKKNGKDGPQNQKNSGKAAGSAAGKAGAKASGAAAGAKSLKTIMDKKPVRKIVEYYYFTDKDINCRDLLAAVGEAYDPKSDIWPDLNLMEVVTGYDSLIFQDAVECFEDPEDLKWLEDHQIKAKYVMSYDTGDITVVREVMKNIMGSLGGIICADTDEFEPSYTLETLDQLR